MFLENCTSFYHFSWEFRAVCFSRNQNRCRLKQLIFSIVSLSFFMNIDILFLSKITHVLFLFSYCQMFLLCIHLFYVLYSNLYITKVRFPALQDAISNDKVLFIEVFMCGLLCSHTSWLLIADLLQVWIRTMTARNSCDLIGIQINRSMLKELTS